MMRAQVFQNAACAWRCWYCFVPYELLKADLARSEWLTPEALTELYRLEPDRPMILDLSGGSPDLVPEWAPWMMTALSNAGLDAQTYLWSDDNLSTSYLFDKLSGTDLHTVRNYRNYGRVCCFKGFDAPSFAFNTRANEADFDRQFEIMSKLLGLGIDLYGYVTLTSPYDDRVVSGVVDFVDRLQALDVNLPLRVIPLQIRAFSPVTPRIAGREEYARCLSIQEIAITIWRAELERRFPPALRATPIADIPLTHIGRA